jgi:C_GCAxxG_C_C family probable redox protein
MTRYTPEQAKADALAAFKDPGPAHLNCSQAVVRFALLVLDADPGLVTVARYFGGGVAGMGEACGALTGTAMALGLRDLRLSEESPDLRPRTTQRLQELIRGFRSDFGTCRCADLTGFDLSNPAERETFLKSEIHDRCSNYVGWMCDGLAPLLLDPESPAAS